MRRVPGFNRDDRAGGGEKRPYSPRGDRPSFNRDDRPRGDGEKRPYTPRGDRGDARPAARFSDRKFGDKKPYTPREGGAEKRPYTPRGDRPQGDRPYSARPSRDGDRPRVIVPSESSAATRSFRPVARRIVARARISAAGTATAARETVVRIAAKSKPWQKRDASSPDHAGRNSRPSRDGARNFDKPRFDKPREERGGAERPRFSPDRPFRERPKFDRPREGRDERPRGDRPQGDRPRFDRPREGGSSWQEHPRNEATGERPRRDNEDDSKVFAKRPAFGGRGEYRERKPEFEKRAARPPREKKSGERIAKVLARAGLASRRDAEEWIVQGRVSVNGRVINSPALDVTENDVITVDGKPLPPRERTRLFLLPQAARPGDDQRRSRRSADGVRRAAARPAARDHRRPARHQHRGPAAADQ